MGFTGKLDQECEKKRSSKSIKDIPIKESPKNAS
jgi:hypothetical protein